MTENIKEISNLKKVLSIEDRKILSGEILDCCIEVHKTLGPGLLEGTYEICLLKEFSLRGIKASSQVKVPIVYKGHNLDQEYRLDILVEDEFIIEIKTVETLLPIHHAQIITYLKLTNKRVGFLVNFNVHLMKNGFHRIIQG